MTENTRTDQAPEANQLWDLLHKEVYTPQEAAEVLNISERIILKSAFGGDLRATIIRGDVISVTRTDLVAWLKWRDGH